MKFSKYLLAFLVFFSVFLIRCFAMDVFIDGEKVMYDQDTTGFPITENGVVLVPFYPTVEAFGVDRIISDSFNGAIIITKGNISISCNTTDKFFIKNGTKIKSEAGLVWKGGPLYVSTDIFSVLDADVYINGSGVIITRDTESGTEFSMFCSSTDKNYRGSEYFGEKYEVQNGLYLGAFPSSGDISDVELFESTYGKKAAAFTIKLNISKPVESYSEQLRYAVKNGKLARIELYCEDYDSLNEEKIGQIARYLGSSGARILLCVMPGHTCVYSDKYDGDSEKYRTVFTKITDIFRKGAPSIAIVWQVCSCNTENSQSFYPGDQYVNYAEYDICKNETSFSGGLSEFTHEYGYKKPILLKADLSNPFFSENSKACLDFCTYLPIKHPSVKAVFFPDFAEYGTLSGNYLNIIRTGVSSSSYLEKQDSLEKNIPYCFELVNGAEVPASKIKIYSELPFPASGGEYVIYKLGGKTVTEAPIKNVPFEAEIDLSDFSGKTVNIGAVIYSPDNQFLAEKNCTVSVGEGVGTSSNENIVSSPFPLWYITAMLVGIAGVFVVSKKINDIFL